MHFRKFDFTFLLFSVATVSSHKLYFFTTSASTVKYTSHAILLSHDHQGARCAYSSPITAAPTTSSHRCCSSRAATSHRRCPFASRCCIHHTHYRSLSFAPAHSLLIGPRCFLHRCAHTTSFDHHSRSTARRTRPRRPPSGMPRAFRVGKCGRTIRSRDPRGT